MIPSHPTEALQGDDWSHVVNPDALVAWMDSEGIAAGRPLANVRLLSGGTQNILLNFQRGGRNMVLRRPPEHLRGNSADTNRREARVLRALAGTDVPHPALIAACSDDHVLGAPFYLMESIEGFNARDRLPMPHRADAAMRHRMGLAIVEGAARLGRLSIEDRSLEAFGQLDNYLERQAPRWAKQLASYADMAGWPGPATLGDFAGVEGWLDSNRPATLWPGIIHGDYHLANVMYCHDNGELAAILDWELATLGDRRIDLGWLIATWPPADGTLGPGVVGSAPWEGFPSRSELVEHYGNFTGGPVEDVRWFAVLACYKLGIILEGTYARACAGKAPVATGDRLHASAQALLAKAKRWCGEDWDGE